MIVTKLINDIENSQALLVDLETKKTNLQLWEEKINNEIQEFVKENKGICPTCHQDIDIGHFIGEEHD